MKTHTIEFEFSAKLERQSFEDIVPKTCKIVFMQTDSLHHKYQVSSDYPQDFAYIGMKMGRYAALTEVYTSDGRSTKVQELEKKVEDLKTKLSLSKEFCNAMMIANCKVLDILCDHNQKPHQVE